VPPNRRVTSPRLALLRAFVATLLVATTLLGVRAAVSDAAISLPSARLTTLPCRSARSSAVDMADCSAKGPVSSSGRAPDF
jgi:hypothetical protein